MHYEMTEVGFSTIWLIFRRIPSISQRNAIRSFPFDRHEVYYM